jgi:carboxylesterase type B
MPQVLVILAPKKDPHSQLARVFQKTAWYDQKCILNHQTKPHSIRFDAEIQYLNVFAPPVAASSNLPVLVFFYGGSWNVGSGSCPLYFGGNFVGSSGEDVILVTMNYRLNVFGFLGGESLRDPSSSGSTGNWGLLDQRESLKWVQRHIASFGGDPSRVTIFGESAGAGSVGAHLVMSGSYGAISSDTGNPLFTNAMMESGNPFTACKPPLSHTNFLSCLE